MKRYLFLATIMSIIACNDQAKKNSTTSDSPVVVVPMDKPLNTEAEKTSQLVDPTPWKIDDAIADRMKKYLNGCSFGCKNKSAIVDYNKPVYDAIREKYPKGQIIEVYARYGEEDQARYCRLRHLDKIPGACDVKKYKTMIYMVTTDSTDSQPQGEYYDIITICPPPRECNKADTLRHL